jgi:23S rRNA pseudouridine2605 synthase
MPDTSSERLNKYLALQLGISRREADNLIEKGSVRINNAPATLGARFTAGDSITVNGKQITSNANLQYVAFHKPIGYVCSRRAQGDNPTIYSILPSELRTLKPVGRLDKDSSGLLLLSNDGDFTFRMTHPKFTKTKVYHVTLDHDLEPLHQQMISDYGVTLEDGSSKLALTRLSDADRIHWEVTMSEGRNRQIRRTFTALGYTVTQLHRIQFGPYHIGALAPGEYINTSRFD